MQAPSWNRLLRRASGSPAEAALAAASLALLLLQVAVIAIKHNFYQYDFRAYYLAERMLRLGLDPYSVPELEALARSLGFADNNHPFIYPPHDLVLFFPLGFLSPIPVYFGWLAFNLACVVALLYAMVKWLDIRPATAAAGMAIGLNGAVSACLRAGQVSLFTAVCLVASVHWLAQAKVGRSALSIFVGGIIKLHTLPLLALVGLRKTRVGFIAIGLGVAAVAAVLALDMWLAPREWATFVGESSTLAHLAVSGPENGGAKNLIETLLSTTGGAPDLTIASIVYMLTAGSILVIGAATCLRLASDADGASPDVTLFGILTFVLALPRVMTYEWVIAVPAVCFFAPKVTPTWARRLVLVLVFLPTLYVRRYGLRVDISVPPTTIPGVLICFENWIACLGVFIAVSLKVLRAPRLVARDVSGDHRLPGASAPTGVEVQSVRLDRRG